MNVATQTFVSPRSCFSVETFSTQADDFSIITSAGYSQAKGVVNASDRPQADTGHGSCGANPLPQTPASLEQQAVVPQRHCFRLDLASPYGRVFV